MQKPDGVKYVSVDNIANFIKDIPIKISGMEKVFKKD